MPELFGQGENSIDIRHLTVEPPEKAKDFEFDYRNYLTPSDWRMMEWARRSLGFTADNHDGIKLALAMTDMDPNHPLLQEVRDREAELLGMLHGNRHGNRLPARPLQIFINRPSPDSSDDRVLLLLRRAGITHPHLDSFAYQSVKAQIDELLLPAYQSLLFGPDLMEHLAMLLELFPELNQPELEAAAGQRILDLIDHDPEIDPYDGDLDELIEYASLMKRVFPSLFKRVVATEDGNWQQKFLEHFLAEQQQARDLYAELDEDMVEPVDEENVRFFIHEMTQLAANLTVIARTEREFSESRDELPEQRRF